MRQDTLRSNATPIIIICGIHENFLFTLTPVFYKIRQRSDYNKRYNKEDIIKKRLRFY